MDNILEHLAVYTGMALTGYTLALAGAQLVGNLVSEKICSQAHLDQVVEEEARKIGVNQRTLVANFYVRNGPNYNNIRGARSKVDDFVFEGRTIPMKVLEIKEGWGASRAAVRHELYHLKKHLPRKKNRLKSFFYEEPTATVYELTGIKL